MWFFPVSGEPISFVSWRFYSLQKGLTWGLLLCLHREGALCSPCEGVIRIHVISGSVFMVPPEASPCSTSPSASPGDLASGAVSSLSLLTTFWPRTVRSWDSPRACSLASRLRVREARLPGLSPGLTGADLKPPSYHFWAFPCSHGLAYLPPRSWLPASCEPPITARWTPKGLPRVPRFLRHGPDHARWYLPMCLFST